MVVLALVILVLFILGPQYWVRYILAKYNKEAEDNFPGTGGEFARHLLNQMNLRSVQVEVTESGDHYDPKEKAVRLTRDKFEGRTLTAITVAAHEVGHAIQDAGGDTLFRWRTGLAVFAVAAQRFGSMLLLMSPFLVLLTRAPAPGLVAALAAFSIMGVGVLVQLVTLPVEWDASFNKAFPLLKAGYLRPQQLKSARRILLAATLTYLAGALFGLLNFWYWLRLLRR